jgi:gluconolactonase
MNRIAPLLVALAICTADVAQAESVIVLGAKVEKLATGFRFTEGPAVDATGNVFFTDIPNNRIHKWSLEGKLSTFIEDSGGANGLYFAKNGALLACEGNRGRLVSLNQKGKAKVLAEFYNSNKFNSPNDLWVRPDGGVYFTDPRYGRRGEGLPQDGEHVYFLSAAGKQPTRVVDDMIRPNGVVGTPDGKYLYIADHGGRKTFRYKIKPDGTLSDKKLFAPQGSDGMTIDNLGNIYLTAKGVDVYNSKGEKIEAISIPESPTNVCFGGKNCRTLFTTARTSLYCIKMKTSGAGVSIKKNAR